MGYLNSSEFIQNTIFRSVLFTQVLKTCRTLLEQSPQHPATKYLKTRHTAASAKKFEFGLFPEDLSVFDPQVLEYLKLTNTYQTTEPLQPYRQVSFFRDHPLIFPVRDEVGNIVGLVGRSFLSDTELKAKNISKYKNSYFVKSFYLYGLHTAKLAIKSTGRVYLTEGQIDTQTCQSRGFLNVVALAGLDFSPFQAYLLRKYGAKELFLLLDNDPEGNSAAEQIAKRYQDYFQTKVLTVPKGKDIDNCIRLYGDFSCFKD